MAEVVAVHAMKGGVGKSTLAVNLAHAMAVAGRRTLLWDLDAQGGASFLLGVEAQRKANRAFAKGADPAVLAQPTAWPGLDIIAADLSLRLLDHALAEAERPKRLRKLTAQLAGVYERVVLDCPPGLGELSDQVLRAADLIVVPLTPAPLALRTLDQTRGRHAASEASGTGAPAVLPVFTMVDRRKTLHRQALAAQPDWPTIPQASVVERMAAMRAPLATFAPSTPAARATAAVAASVERMLQPAP